MSGYSGGSPAATIGRDHVDSLPAAIEKAMKDSGGPMRENGAGAACKHGRQEKAVATEDAMTNGVDPLMDPVKPTRGEALSCQLSVEAGVLQLPQRHQPVLPIGELPDLMVKARPRQPPTGRFRSI